MQELDTEIPAFLRVPQAERNAAWERNPPRAMPPMVGGGSKPRSVSDADVEAFMKSQEERKAKVAVKKKNVDGKRIDAMKAGLAIKAGMRWDSGKGRFVPDEVGPPKINATRAAMAADPNYGQAKPEPSRRAAGKRIPGLGKALAKLEEAERNR